MEEAEKKGKAEEPEKDAAKTGEVKPEGNDAPEGEGPYDTYRGVSESGDTVLCGANSYEEKYYFNPLFSNLPEEVQNELKILTVLYTEECGGILTLEFTADGTLNLKTRVSDYDYYYDEIEAGLKIRELAEEKRELFEMLELYYKTFFLKED